MRAKRADWCDLCHYYTARNGERAVGQRALNVDNGLLLLKVLNFVGCQEWREMVVVVVVVVK